MYIIDDQFSPNILLKRCKSTLNEHNFDNSKNLNNKSSKKYFSRNKEDGMIAKKSLTNYINNKKFREKYNKYSNYNTNYIFCQKNQNKGTNLPEQFSRNNCYRFPSIKKNSQKNINISEIDSEKSSYNKEKKDEKNYVDINNIGIRKRIYKPYVWDKIDEKELINQRDKMMPEGFQFYEKLIEKENKKYFENNYIIKKHQNKKLIPILIRDAFKDKIEESDIFFKNNNIKKKDCFNEISKNKQLAIQTFYSSDIFNKKIDPFIIKKSGEISYFKNKEKIVDKDKIENIVFNKNSETTKGWGVRKSLPSLLNYSSTEFNPLNPSIKNFSKTKDKIMNESEKKYKGYNIIKKQKSLSEFIDLTNVNASNYNINYNKALNNNPNTFRKNENMFTEYYKIYYNNYNSISDKPFYRFIPSLDNSNQSSHDTSINNNSNLNRNLKLINK